MRTHKRLWTWIFLTIGVLVGVHQIVKFVYCNDTSSEPIEEIQPEAVTVSVGKVRRGDIRNTISVTGEVRPLTSVDVVPKIAGRLERLRRPDGTLIEEGVMVEKQAVVAVVEHARLDAAVRSAEAAFEVARAAHEAAEVDLADCRREKKRWINLREQGSGTQKQLDQALTAFERARVQVRQTQARIAQAEAALEEARVRLNEATVEAPISGVVSRKYLDEGAFVGPSTPLFKIVELNPVEVTGGVSARYYPKLRVGKTVAEVEVDAYPDEVFRGVVARVRPEVDQVTRTTAVTIRVPNPEMKLKPGMYARMSLVVEERKGVPLISDDTLLSGKDNPMVYVVSENRLVLRPIRLGLEEGSMNEVVGGLEVGDMIVAKAQQTLKEGMKVKTREVESE